ncbi:hypothetical protein GA0070624_2655 [Micromonospora rhizosphaerae]|uniref:Uncharacterized protein n=1 Tax=Micromonospora rhizosphaerae TaxID=568872 RepID=A0A1C6S0V2_9ACTN|nr:hypothetical protein [Micromonospora rhizosphaerae]SCL23024.1 hypothetical protein GA0070624_2655 [Micromonospora rhizosphaerae]
MIRRDDELAAYDLDRLLAGDGAPAARFPTPWPRRAGGIDAVSPTLDMAVFSGQHALHAVDAAGATAEQLVDVVVDAGWIAEPGASRHRFTAGCLTAWVRAEPATATITVCGADFGCPADLDLNDFGEST